MGSCLSVEEAKKARIAALCQTSRLFSTGSCLALTDSKCFKEDAGTDNSATASLTKNFPPNPGQFLVGLCLEIPKKKMYVFVSVHFIVPTAAA